ncbi:secreted RxLR effector protein 161-like [Humulus lupulus]|uniref:secreted RxLR effector protein 161-like n=1 Tax=Humulus lupulus TaxID=3486 RepID=UPI002B400E85|nr:secreted RxLR effector protein 161-like [Humulus lupulus]
MQDQTDHTLFIKQSEIGKMSILIVYVDDIIVTGNHSEEMILIKEMLAKEFEVKDLGALRYFLGMEFARSKRGISVFQRKYTLDLLNETVMLGSKPNKTPIELREKRKMFEGSSVDKGGYQQLVGKLIYLSHTKPDIAFVVSLVSQYMHDPCQEHLNAVYRILRYLKQTPGKGLFFKKTTERKVEVFTYANWAGLVDDRKSTSGYYTIVWGNVVTWRSKKQTVVARISADAKYRAMAHGVCEAIWINRLLGELKI